MIEICSLRAQHCSGNCGLHGLARNLVRHTCIDHQVNAAYEDLCKVECRATTSRMMRDHAIDTELKRQHQLGGTDIDPEHHPLETGAGDIDRAIARDNRRVCEIECDLHDLVSGK